MADEQSTQIKAAEAAPAAQQEAPKQEAEAEKAASKARVKRQPKQASAEAAPAGVMTRRLLFDKYSFDVDVADLSLRNYINLRPSRYPISYRRGSQKPFSKVNVGIIERLENSLMRGGTGSKVGGHVIRTEGRLQGKKLKVIKIIEEAFDIVNSRTGANPVQVLIKALENSAPIEDTTHVVYGGITSNVAVDVSASRRLDIALRNIAHATVIGAFGNERTMAEALANELILASNADINSFALKRKNEIERMARSAK
jgi:small subunit ribosomal protein S7